MASRYANRRRGSSGSNSPLLSASGCSTDLDEDDAQFIDRDHHQDSMRAAEPLKRTLRSAATHRAEDSLRCTPAQLIPSLSRNVTRPHQTDATPIALNRQRRTSLCQSMIEELTPQAVLPKTHAPGRRIIPTSINLKTLRKQSGSLGSPTVPHSPDSHASTTTPLSPLGGGESHFGDTIQSNNSSTQTGESAAEFPAQPSPLAQFATALPKSRHQAAANGAAAAPLVSRMATSNRQSAADRSILSWHELDPLSVKVNPAYWSSLMVKVNPQSDDWQSQCLGMCDIRRIVIHHPALFRETMVCPSRRNAVVNVADAVVTSLTGLADSIRSAVARAAMTALNDVYLFVSEYISGNCVHDCLSLCLKKCSGPSGAFIADEASRTAKQIILVADPFRILSTLATILTKSATNNPTLKSKCIDALAFFALRLDVNSLDLVLAHKDFASQLLKPILKTASDANPASRTSAARCIIVLLNLVPDLLQRFRTSLTEVDVNALFGRIHRTSNFEIKSYYGISTISTTYQNIPESANIDTAIEKLQTVLANVEMIMKHPMPLAPPGGRATTPAKARTETATSVTSLRSRADSAIRSRVDVSTVSGISNFGRPTAERPSLVGDRLFQTGSPSYTPSRQRQTTLTNRKVSQQYSTHRNWLQDEDSCEEELPSNEPLAGARAMSVLPSRDRTACTPPRYVVDRPRGTTPTLVSTVRGYSRMRETGPAGSDCLRQTTAHNTVRTMAGQSSQRRMISSGATAPGIGGGATSPPTRDTSLLRRRW